MKVRYLTAVAAITWALDRRAYKRASKQAESLRNRINEGWKRERASIDFAIWLESVRSRVVQLSQLQGSVRHKDLRSAAAEMQKEIDQLLARPGAQEASTADLLAALSEVLSDLVKTKRQKAFEEIAFRVAGDVDNFLNFAALTDELDGRYASQALRR